MAEGFTWSRTQANTFGAVNIGQTFAGSTGGDAAPAVTSTMPQDGMSNVAVDANIVINFSETVNLDSSGVQLDCGSGPLALELLSAAPAGSYTLDPAANLPFGAICTLNLSAASVGDEDANDPPENLATDFNFSFRVMLDPQAACAEPATTISAVQGNGMANPIVGQSVAVRGAVVGDFQGSGQFNGYFISSRKKPPIRTPIRPPPKVCSSTAPPPSASATWSA